jgi:serpin B
MMSQRDTFDFARDGDVQIVELPYRGNLSMVVVLPDHAGDLAATERKVARRYATWLAALRPALVDLWLPRWTSRSRMDLTRLLVAAGMKRAFDSDANLSGTSDVPLHIDKVIQEAFIEVTEAGTEAAAATAVIESEDSAEEGPPPKLTIVHADRPFLYFIRDQSTGAVLFAGRVTDLR